MRKNQGAANATEEKESEEETEVDSVDTHWTCGIDAVANDDSDESDNFDPNDYRINDTYYPAVNSFTLMSIQMAARIQKEKTKYKTKS